jgi:hypothetical protein
MGCFERNLVLNDDCPSAASFNVPQEWMCYWVVAVVRWSGGELMGTRESPLPMVTV